MATIGIPAPLRCFTQQNDHIVCQGATLREVLDSLTNAYPDLRKYIFDERGETQRFISIYLKNEHNENLPVFNLDTKIENFAMIVIVTALVGG